MSENNTRLGIWLMVAATVIFAIQDGLSRHLADEYHVMMVVMIRYWFFAAFVIFLAKRQGILREAWKTEQLGLQIFRGILLAAEICVTVLAFVWLGLIESHAVFACYPLLVALLSGPVLGEQVGWKRLTAIAIGFVGILIILQPGSGVFSPAALVPLLGAAMFALYGLLTRYAARKDSAMVSFFWTGIAGSVFMTLVGIWFWKPMASSDWFWMLTLCMTGVLAHWMLIKCYAVAEASAVQPFAYLQLVWVSIIGVSFLGETLRTNVMIGGVVVVGAGVFALWRERVAAKRAT